MTLNNFIKIYVFIFRMQIVIFLLPYRTYYLSVEIQLDLFTVQPSTI